MIKVRGGVGREEEKQERERKSREQKKGKKEKKKEGDDTDGLKTDKRRETRVQIIYISENNHPGGESRGT